MLRLVYLAIVAALVAGFLTQLNYVLLDSYVNLGLLIRAELLIATVLFALGTLLRIRDLRFNRRSVETIVVTSSVTFSYFCLLAIAYGNTNVFFPLLFVIFPFFLFKMLAVAVSFETRKQSEVISWVVFVLLAASFVVHYTQAGRHLADAASVKFTGSRYGVLEGRSIINITAANLSYALSASAVFLFSLKNRRYFLLFLPALAFGGYALLATASLSGILAFAFVLFCLFLSYFSRRTVRRVVTGAVLIIPAILVASVNFTDSPAGRGILFSLLEFRLSTSIVETTSVRLDNLQSAFSLDSLLFGQGKTSAAVLGRSSDNLVAATVIEAGLVGLVLVIAWFLVLVIKYITSSFIPAVSFIGASLIQALSEDHFASPSTVLTYSGLVFAHWVWSKKARCPDVALSAKQAAAP